MFPNLSVCLIVGNTVKVGLKAVHQSVFGLAYILDRAFVTRDAINEVGAFARDIVFRDVTF